MIRRPALALLLALIPSLASAQFATIGPTPPVTDNGDRLATTAWINNFFSGSLPLASGKIFIGSAGGIATAQTPSGDCTLVPSGVITCTQAAGNFLVNGTLTVSGMVVDGNGELMTNIAAPATPAAGTTRVYVDSTTKALTFKNDAGTVGNAVVPSTAVANQFMTGISAAGIISRAQPAFTDLSGQGTCAQEPALTGDVTTPAGSCATTLASVITAGGPTGSATVAPIITYDAKGRLTAVSSVAITPAIGSITGLGTGIATALGINVGTAGSVVVNGGALGTPSSGVGTNLTGVPTTALTGTLQAAQEPAHTGGVTNSAGSLVLTVVTNANLSGDVTSVGNATTLATGNAGNLNSGTMLAARMPALTGDCTTSAGAVATTCTKTNSVAFGALATVTPGTGVATALGNNTNASGGVVTSPVPNANLANSATTVAGQTCTLGSTCGLSSITNSVVAPVTMTTKLTYYDGPSVAQGSTGTWFVSGTITVNTAAVSDQVLVKIWDGTTLIASGYGQAGSGQIVSVGVSGVITSPVGNLRISATNATTNGGTIATGNGIDAKASTVTAFRIQ